MGKYHNEYYKQHKERIAASQKKWKGDNKEKVRQIQRDWRAANPEKVLEYSRKQDKLNAQNPRVIKRKADFSKEYWAIPENKERRRKNAFRRYRTNREKYGTQRHITEIRKVIRLIGVLPESKFSLEALYDLMVKVINENLDKAHEILLAGVPDASAIKIEFKIGFDRLRSNQLIWNILNSNVGKVRWSPSYDDIEIALQGGPNKTRLFESYKDFIIWEYGLKENNGSTESSSG